MRYFLAHNSIDVFHHGELNEDQVISTGQPNLEYFDNLTALEERLAEFGVICNEKETPILPQINNCEDEMEIPDPS